MQGACALLSSVACPVLQTISTLSHKRHNFRKEITEYKMCVLIFSTCFVWNISHSKKNWTRYDQKMCIGVYVKSPLLLSGINETWIFSTDFRQNNEISNFTKIRSAGAQLFHTEKRTDGRTWYFAILWKRLKLFFILVLVIITLILRISFN